jgi:hypothetical protein
MVPPWTGMEYTGFRRRPRERKTRPVLTGFPAPSTLKVPIYAYSIRKHEV